MPFVARWPGKIKAGTTNPETICFTDMMATFAALAGATLPADAGEDSYNLLPALLGEPCASPLREATVMESSAGVLAIRQGPWKLIPHLGSGGFTKPATQKPKPGDPVGQLYDLFTDPGEMHNVYADHPDLVGRLAAELTKCQREPRSAPMLNASR